MPYFASAFTGAFAEASTSEIYLADEDPAAIEQFISWLYRGSKGLSASGNDLVPLVRLYILADMWCTPTLQNNLMDFLIGYFREHSVEGLKAMTMVVEACYIEMISMQKLRRMLLFHTVELTFKAGTVDGDFGKVDGDFGKVDGDFGTADGDLRALLKCNVNFATDLAFWQLVHFGQKKNMLGKVTKKEFYV